MKIAAALLPFSLIACGGVDDLDESSAGLTGITETIVTIDAGEIVDIRDRQLTFLEADDEALEHAAFLRGERDLSNDARHTVDGAVGTTRSGIAREPSCIDASIWLYRQPNQMGNRICFRGMGGVDLRSVTGCDRCQFLSSAAPWGGNVQSIWTGESPSTLSGYMLSFTGSTSICQINTSPMTRQNVAPGCTEFLYLGAPTLIRLY